MTDRHYRLATTNTTTYAAHTRRGNKQITNLLRGTSSAKPTGDPTTPTTTLATGGLAAGSGLADARDVYVTTAAGVSGPIAARSPRSSVRLIPV